MFLLQLDDLCMVHCTLYVDHCIPFQQRGGMYINAATSSCMWCLIFNFCEGKLLFLLYGMGNTVLTEINHSCKIANVILIKAKYLCLKCIKLLLKTFPAQTSNNND